MSKSLTNTSPLRGGAESRPPKKIPQPLSLPPYYSSSSTSTSATASTSASTSSSTPTTPTSLTTLSKLSTLQRTYCLEQIHTIPKVAQSQSSSQVNDTMKEFNDFVKTLGGESHEGLNDEHVRDMFTNGLHNKRFPSTQPPRVYELSRIPASLRREKTILHTDHIPWENVQTSKRGQSPQRMRYGAWYIPPTQWRVVEPETGKELVTEGPELRKRSDALRNEISGMQGAKLFKDYLTDQQSNIPKFLATCTGIPAPPQPRRKSSFSP